VSINWKLNGICLFPSLSAVCIGISALKFFASKENINYLFTKKIKYYGGQSGILVSINKHFFLVGLRFEFRALCLQSR
jgi:hypothetical protein